MYEQNSDIVTPKDDEAIWRYLSLDKYLDLLVTKKLFLCRLDKLDDPWEGGWTEKMRKNLSCGNTPEGLIKLLRVSFFINCWHLNSYESAAMWDIYSSKNAGIAIKTTVGNLKNSLLDSDKKHYIGKVDYEYFEKGSPKIYITNNPSGFTQDRDDKVTQMCFNKRRSFEHEKELRLMEFVAPEKDNDINTAALFSHASVDLSKLINEIYLSPLMPDWLVKSVMDVSDKYCIDTKLVKKSNLYDQVIY